MIHEFLPDKVAEDVIEVLGAIIVALETETLDDTFVDKLAGEKTKTGHGTCRSRARDT